MYKYFLYTFALFLYSAGQSTGLVHSCTTLSSKPLQKGDSTNLNTSISTFHKHMIFSMVPYMRKVGAPILN